MENNKLVKGLTEFILKNSKVSLSSVYGNQGGCYFQVSKPEASLGGGGGKEASVFYFVISDL